MKEMEMRTEKEKKKEGVREEYNRHDDRKEKNKKWKSSMK